MRRRIVLIVLALPVLLLAAAASGWLWLWHTESGAQWAWNQAVSALAEGPRSALLQGRLQGTLARGLQLNGLSYRDSDVTATADSASLAGGVGFSPVRITISRLALREVAVDLHPVAENEQDPGAPGEGIDLMLPWPIVVRDLQVDVAEIRKGEDKVAIGRIAGRAEWFRTLTLELREATAPDLSGSMKLRSELAFPFQFESEISIDRFRVPDALREQMPWVGAESESSWTVRGDINRQQLDGEVAWPEWMPHARVAAEISDPFLDLGWSLELAVTSALVPGDLISDGLRPPDSGGSDTIELKDLRLAGNGTLSRYALSGQTGIASAWLSSDSISFEGQGGESGVLNWSTNGEAELHASGWPSGSAGFTASGTPDRLMTSINAPDLFGGSLSVDAEIAFDDRSTWQAQVSARQISTSPLLEALLPFLGDEPGEQLESIRQALEIEALDADFAVEGKINPLQFSSDIERLQGQVRGSTVVAGGHLEYGDDNVVARNLLVQSGASRIVLDGTLNAPPGIDLEVEIDDLGEVLAEASGKISGTLHALIGKQGASVLSAEFEGSDIDAFGWTLESISTRLDGDFDQHSLDVAARSQDIDVVAALAGGPIRDPKSGNFIGWRGLLQQLALSPSEGPSWVLTEPASLSYAGQFELQPACFTPGGDSLLCLDILEQAGGKHEGHLTLDAFSPNLASELAGWPLDFSQNLQGEVSWSLEPGESVSASGHISISKGVIVDVTEGLALLTTGDGTLSFQIDRGSLNAGEFDIPFDGGNIDVDFSVPDIATGTQSELIGKIRIDVDDLRSFSNLLPQLSQTTGNLHMAVDFSGTAADPRFEGEISLRNGGAFLPALGTRLQEIVLDGQLGGDNRIRLEGGFLAGAGRGELLIDLDLTEPFRPLFEARLHGDGLTLVDIPDIQLIADADLGANWNNEQLALSGSIHIPSGRFSPSYLPSQTASESPDVVIVSGGSEATVRPAEPPVNIVGELGISMGDDVVIDLDIAKAKMTGDVKFSWKGETIPVANGQYDLQGEIQAYGQRLEITKASIRFPNIPANNPSLDIRAERKIYGNSSITEAGVLVFGTLKRPQTEPYTVPASNADRARALLITGSDFDYEQGVGAVNVGTYIAPKLFLSYGVGLFEQGNVITARYELKQNLGVKATSGQDETGIDISYTIER